MTERTKGRLVAKVHMVQQRLLPSFSFPVVIAVQLELMFRNIDLY